MKVKEFINELKENVRDYNKLVSLRICPVPNTSWEYRLEAPATNVVALYEPNPELDMVFISNAFSGEVKIFNTERLISELKDFKMDAEVAFEIYGFNGECNEQIICRSSKGHVVCVLEDENSVSIILYTESI